MNFFAFGVAEEGIDCRPAQLNELEAFPLLLPIKRLFLPAAAILAIIAMIPQFINQEDAKPPSIEWIKMPGAALDIDISMEGDAWIAGVDGHAKKWDGSQWVDFGGSAVRVAAGPAGNTWIINAQNQIFRWHKGGWAQMPGTAKDIAIGASGAIWMISTEPAPGGYRVYKWGDIDWVMEDAAGEKIAVGPKGNAWILNDKNEIFRLTRMVWKQAPDLARDIAIAANGVTWILSPAEKPEENSSPRFWAGKKWITQSATFTAIATDARAYPWGINNRNEIFADARSQAIKRK